MLAAFAAAHGLDTLGRLTTGPRPVLDLALEDTRRRYRDRALKLLASLNTSPASTFDLRTSSPRASAGGLKLIEDWLKQNPGGLVVVDTLAKFRDPSKGRNSYEEDYRAVGDLKVVADRYDGAVLVITHTRKGVADDPFDEVSGTLGLNGAADAIQVPDRQRGTDTAALYMTGRDLAEQTLTLAWDKAMALWSIGGRVDGVERPERVSSPNKVDKCLGWLRCFLEAFSWPDGELIAAAEQNGYTGDNVKEAMVRLRKSDPPLSSKPRGKGGEWWNWIGPKNCPLPDRTEAARRELLDIPTSRTPETPES